MKKKIIILFILLPFGVFAQTAKYFYDEGLKAADLNEQIKLFTKAIEKSPKHIMAYHHRADAYKDQGAFKKALADYSKIISLASKDPFKYYARALFYIEQKNYSAAIDDLSEAINLKKNHDIFYYQRALAYMETGKYLAALKDIEKIKNKMPEIMLLQGEGYFYTFSYSTSRHIFEEILNSSPDNITALFFMGRINFNNELYDEAISYFSKVINRDAAYAAAYRLRAASFNAVEEYDAAVKDYTSLIALEPDCAYYNRRGVVYEDMKNFDAAISDYTKAISINPKWAIPYNSRAFIYLRQKEYKKAKSDLDIALKLADNMPLAYINMAGYYWLSKKDKKNMYKYLDLALKHNFKDFDYLYEDDQQGWMFKNISNTVEFRSFISEYSK